MGPCFAISRKVCLVLVVLQVLVLCMLCRTLALHSDSNARSLQARSKLQVASSQCISWPESCNASRPASNESPVYRLNATRCNPSCNQLCRAGTWSGDAEGDEQAWPYHHGRPHHDHRAQHPRRGGGQRRRKDQDAVRKRRRGMQVISSHYSFISFHSLHFKVLGPTMTIGPVV